MNTEILLDHEPTRDGYRVRALLRLTGEAPESEGRAPLDLGVVLDRSGSMHGPKLACALEAVRLLVRRLGPEDRISVVAYDDTVETVAERVPATRREEVLRALEGVGPGGMTNLSGGWMRGRELVGGGMVPEAGEEAREGDGEPGEREGPVVVRRVLLLTDGLANVGITDPGRLRDLVGSAAADGVGTTTLGFGTNYDERLLRALSEAGGGSMYYIEEPDQAPPVFEAELEGLVSLAAQNVRVELEGGPAGALVAVRHRYPTTEGPDGSLRLELGDLYAGEPRSLLMEFQVPRKGNENERGEVEVATLTVDAHVMLPGGGVEKRSVTLPVRVTPSEVAVVSPEVRRELLVLDAARARDEALEERREGDMGAGARKLREAATRIEEHAEASGALDAELEEEVRDLEAMAERFETEQVREEDAKYMYQRAYSVESSRPASRKVVEEERRRRGEDA